MRLECLDEVEAPRPLGVLKTFHYRPEVFGRSYSAALDLAMRSRRTGPRAGASCSRRCLIPEPVSILNDGDGAVAAYTIGHDVWRAVVTTGHRAHRREAARTLGFLEKLTLSPQIFSGASDADAVLRRCVG